MVDAARRAAAHPADRAQDLQPGQGAAEGDALADHAAGLEERGLLPRARSRRLAEVDDVPGCRRVLGRQPAADPAAAGAPVRAVPRRPALGREAHGQRAARSTATCRASSRARSRPSGRPRRSAPRPWRRAPTRRSSVRAATSYYDICDTESCQVYGGVGDEHPAATRRCRRRAAGSCIYQGAAGVHPVLLEQRRLQLGRLAALPGRAARPLRGVLGQPERPVDRHADPRADREDLARGRDAREPVVHPRRPRCALRRPGHLGDAHRQPAGLPTSVKVTGDDFRFRLGLKSTWFELAARPER